MADPTTTESATGTVASGAAGQSTGSVLDQLSAQMAALTNTVNELTNKLNTVSQAVRNTSTTEDTNMEVSTIGNDDAFIGLRNERVQHNAINSQVVRLIAAAVDHYHECNKRSLDHYSALPPIAPRAATGPGTSGS